MSKISLLSLCTITAMAQTSIPMQFHANPAVNPQSAGGTVVGTSRSDFGQGLTIHTTTMVQPGLAHGETLNLGAAFKTESNSVHMMLVDQAHQQYFGYDLTASRGPSEDQYTVTFAPLSLTPQEFHRPNKGPLFPAPLPTYPGPQVVQDGDTIALDLLVSPDGRQKVVDYIRISAAKPASDPPAATSTAAPKDFTPDDGPVKFDLAGAKVYVNGQKFSGVTAFTGRSGAATFWFAVPGDGRYIMSLAPHDGFQKMGAIRDNTIQFQALGGEYEVRQMQPIVGSGGAWNLYMLRDPAYLPNANIEANHGTVGPTLRGGSDRLENLLPKQ